MSNAALAGVAATREAVIVADRDPADRIDIFRCYNVDGSERWTLRYPAPGELDYGNSSRSTPFIHGDTVFLSGAHGHFHAVELATGNIRWKKQFQRDFNAPSDLSWGFCASPLVFDGRLYLHPGGPQAALVAVDPATGEVLWKSPGEPPGHSSLVPAQFAGRKQIIGFDKQSLGAWDATTGERIWTVKPKLGGEFNVPTPIVTPEQVLVASETNGARVYAVDARGQVDAQPQATNDHLLPDCQSPVLVGNRLYGVANGLFCLDVSRRLAEVWHCDDPLFSEYASLIGSPSRILVTTLRGKLLLINLNSDRYEKVAELDLFDDEQGLYSHPAIVGQRLYVRGSKSLVCVDLAAQ